jgi:serine phosphatase RsbU (regulator of sigma subunit)
VGVVVAGILIAFFMTRSIVRPVNSVRRKLISLSQGIYSAQKVKASNDEIGDMAKAVDVLISSFEKTKEFSMQVGSGNFDVKFDPLSEHDELGKALIRMKTDLASYRDEMEKLVADQTHEIREQKDRIEEQKERVTHLYNDLQASIRYAQRLQESFLPGDDYIKALFPDSFVFFKPKATVSGDFYWFKMQGGKKIFAAADCTGHGVPGAFMSLVGHNVLNQVTKVYTKPSQILNNMNRMAIEVIRSKSDEKNLRDGMDVALCTLDPETLQLEFSGAHNPVYLIRNDELIQIESDPYAIGSFSHGEKEYTNHSVQLQPGDCLYMFSDGFADQFGGPNGKKFMRKQFRMSLLGMNHLPMKDQYRKLEEIFDKWKGELDQVDDILVMGIRI